MAFDKLLTKIQSQFDELTTVLELFVDPSVQPSVEDCEKLQQQLTQLQENLAVYKFHKLNKEISPSFNLHAKVSEKESIAEPVKESEAPTESSNTKTDTGISESKPREVNGNKQTVVKINQHIQIGVNDKFRFINELFAQNTSEYNIAIEQLVNLPTWHDSEVYMSSLKNLYAWKENNEVVKHFYSIIKKRFD